MVRMVITMGCFRNAELIIIKLDFEGCKLVGKYEHCHVEKEFKGNQQIFDL